MKPVKKSKSIIVLNIAASIIILFAIAHLATNIIIFKRTIDQYVAQGYSAIDVTKQLLLAQLLPGIFQPVAVYGGIALGLFGIAILLKKNAECLALLTKANEFSNTIEESIPQENAIEAEATAEINS